MRGTATILASLLLASLVATPAHPEHEQGPLWFDRVAEPGYVVTPYAAAPAVPTAMAFGPGGDLYVTTFAGSVHRHRNLGGVVGGPPEPVIEGFDRPLGLAFGPEGALYVSSVDPDKPQDERPWGMVSRFALEGPLPMDASAGEKVLVDVPNGVHTLSGLALGPDGRLYVGNASSSVNGDSAPGEGPPEVDPITMAILRFDPADAAGSPLSALRYRGSGAASEDPVDVVANGIHNPHDLAFRGDDLYTGSNAPQGQEPLGEDVVVRVEDAPGASLADGTLQDFGSPGCLYTHDELGWPVGRPSTYEHLPEEERTCEGRVPVLAAVGLHRGSTGISIAPEEGFGPRSGDVFLAEWGSLFGEVRGHKVVRVGLDAEGDLAAADDGGPDIADFLVGVSPIDIAFHDGAMYVADFGTSAILRVIPAV